MWSVCGGFWGVWGVFERLEDCSALYAASRVVHDALRDDLRAAVVDVLRSGVEPAVVVGLCSFSRQTVYEIAGSLG